MAQCPSGTWGRTGRWQTQTSDSSRGCGKASLPPSAAAISPSSPPRSTTTPWCCRPMRRRVKARRPACRSCATCSGACWRSFDRELVCDSAEIVIDGDLAFDRGSFTQTLREKETGMVVRERGHYLWLYVRRRRGLEAGARHLERRRGRAGPGVRCGRRRGGEHPMSDRLRNERARGPGARAGRAGRRRTAGRAGGHPERGAAPACGCTSSTAASSSRIPDAIA